MNFSVVLSIFAILVIDKAEGAPPNWYTSPDFGNELSKYINEQVQQSLSGLKGLDRLQNLGSEISQSVQTQLDNEFWFKGENVCVKEEVSEVPSYKSNVNYYYSTGTIGMQNSQICQGTNNVFTCTKFETTDGTTRKITKIYTCCENYSLGYNGEKKRCLKNN
ncbi:uncharacterized protein LOC132265503 [Phlebotomus argentipes]|uniref:uncharacterized protein LOC132265503 n=1 Tax=Phlebotomus argentipes TaxID=94469 RepID=UPI0028934F5C|nr:uncharacterized protein LOC132265503 [Phlebotomus argentipes]